MLLKASINDLPKYSSWPARLLCLTKFEQRYKTPNEIIREYDREKWGSLLERVNKAGKDVTLDEIDDWFLNNTQEILCSIEDEFYIMHPIEAHKRYVSLIENYLSKYLPATSLVELGAGYGSIILGISHKEKFVRMNIMAAEYTNSGISLIKHLAKSKHLEIIVDKCDFSSVPVTKLPIPDGAIIFTSYATPYVPIMPVSFIESLASYKPKTVIHFEPCYEHCDRNTLIGLLRQRYIEVNDYNKNLVTLIHDQHNKGLVKIQLEEKSVFGSNPLLPISVLAWEPN